MNILFVSKIQRPSSPVILFLSISTPFPLLQTPGKTRIMETEETVNDLLKSEIEAVTSTNCESGDFYLDMAEWGSIYISSNEKMSLSSNWRNVLLLNFRT